MKMNELLIAISNLVQGQTLCITVDQDRNYVFKLQTTFGREAKPFCVIKAENMELIKYHFENGDLDEHLAGTIDSLIDHMDEAVLNMEPETY